LPIWELLILPAHVRVVAAAVLAFSTVGLRPTTSISRVAVKGEVPMYLRTAALLPEPRAIVALAAVSGLPNEEGPPPTAVRVSNSRIPALRNVRPV